MAPSWFGTDLQLRSERIVDAGGTTGLPPVGLKPGERSSYSPLLFSLLINELVTVVREKGTGGVQFVRGMALVFLLLFADDVALESLTPGASE